jgi:hypothetical protein
MASSIKLRRRKRTQAGYRTIQREREREERLRVWKAGSNNMPVPINGAV